MNFHISEVNDRQIWLMNKFAQTNEVTSVKIKDPLGFLLRSTFVVNAIFHEAVPVWS
jgi:hypothetical protein